MRTNVCITLIAAAIFLVGCESIVHIPYKNETANQTTRLPESRQEILDHYSYKAEPLVPEVIGVSTDIFEIFEDETFRKTTLRIDATQKCGAQRYSVAEYYQRTNSHNNTKKRLVIVLSIPDSEHTFPQDTITSNLISWIGADTNVLLVRDNRSPFDWALLRKAESETEFLEVIDCSVQTMLGMIIDTRRWVDWVEKRDGIDPKRIGIVGFSSGAIYAPIVMGVDPRISVGVFMLGGGHLNKIFISHNNEDMNRIRGKVLKQFGWTLAEFEERLKEPFHPIDPITYAWRINPDRVFFIDAKYDDSIPRVSIEDLWESLGRPERVTLPYRHRLAFITMTIVHGWYVNDAIVAFFLKKL